MEVALTQSAHQADVSELQIQLPKQLVARFSTLQKACLAATFETGPPPGKCASTAKVGTVSVTTPVLPGKLTGTAWFVSHGAEAFPDLDLVVTGDGVEVVLVGHTHIAHSSITTSTYESLPDVPITNVTVKLPVGSNSALADNGRLCNASLLAPTTIIAQSGAKITANTKVAVSGCSVELVSHKQRGKRLVLKVWTPEAGRISVKAPGLRTKYVRVSKSRQIKISVPLSSRALAAMHSRKKLKLRVGFTPKKGKNYSAAKLALR